MKTDDSNAYAVALKFLSESERFEAEVRKKLESFPQEEVERAISDLKAKNILNDRRTGESFCKLKSGRRALGTFGLEQQLRQRGAPEELISEFSSGWGEMEKAKTLLESKFLPESDQKQRAFRFLVSRGFNFESAHNAVRDFFPEDV